jgi:hypothetical protein
MPKITPQHRSAEKLEPVAIRLPASLWRKCAVAAANVGLSRTDFLRMALTRATRGTKLSPLVARAFTGTDKQLKLLDRIAEKAELSSGEVIEYLLDRSLEVGEDQAFADFSAKYLDGVWPATE